MEELNIELFGEVTRLEDNTAKMYDSIESFIAEYDEDVWNDAVGVNERWVEGVGRCYLYWSDLLEEYFIIVHQL